jgi:hypothetical protein
MRAKLGRHLRIRRVQTRQRRTDSGGGHDVRRKRSDGGPDARRGLAQKHGREQIQDRNVELRIEDGTFRSGEPFVSLHFLLRRAKLHPPVRRGSEDDRPRRRHEQDFGQSQDRETTPLEHQEHDDETGNVSRSQRDEIGKLLQIVKSPKLYFYDTGLLCHLLGIKNITALKKNKTYGFLFENWVISEIRKNNFNLIRFLLASFVIFSHNNLFL